MKLKDKVAIVTGGSQGIGEAIAIRYAAEGAKVAVVYHKDDEAAARTVGKITSAGGIARATKADCSKIPQIEQMVGRHCQGIWYSAHSGEQCRRCFARCR